jgi:hypothetical protein
MYRRDVSTAYDAEREAAAGRGSSCDGARTDDEAG